MSKRHSQAGEHRDTDKSGHGKNQSEQGALTNWRAQMDGQVRAQKKSKQTRGTHFLRSKDGWTSKESKQGALTNWSTDGQTSQDTERNQASEGHLLSREHRQTDKSGHKRKPSKQGALTL